jgi:hypothetical protein
MPEEYINPMAVKSVTIKMLMNLFSRTTGNPIATEFIYSADVLPEIYVFNDSKLLEIRCEALAKQKYLKEVRENTILSTILLNQDWTIHSKVLSVELNFTKK